MDHQSPAPDPAEGNPKNHIMKVMVHGDEIEFFLFVRWGCAHFNTCKIMDWSFDHVK